MALILNLETSTKVCSVALAENKKLLTLKESNDPNFSHAEKLMGFIREVIDKAGKQITDLDTIAISQGPGSYTGLRIGTSTAKGLCYALNIPLIAISTLQSMCFNKKLESFDESTLLAPMLDARRMEVYTSLFDLEKKELSETSAKVIDGNSFSHELNTNKICFFGDGAAKCKKVIKHKNAFFIDDIKTSAWGMITLSEEKFRKEQFENVAYFAPFYLKEFIAGKPKKLV